MLAKILTLLAILVVIYVVFFKHKRSNEIKDSKKDKKADSFVECSKCGTFVEIDEAILSSGKYICEECNNANHRS